MERANLWDYVEGMDIPISLRDQHRIPSLRAVCGKVRFFGDDLGRLSFSSGRYEFCKDYQRHELRLVLGGAPQGKVILNFPGRFREDETGVLYKLQGQPQQKDEKGRLVLNLRNLERLTVAHYVGNTNYLIGIRKN